MTAGEYKDKCRLIGQILTDQASLPGGLIYVWVEIVDPFNDITPGAEPTIERYMYMTGPSAIGKEVVVPFGESGYLRGTCIGPVTASALDEQYDKVKWYNRDKVRKVKGLVVKPQTPAA